MFLFKSESVKRMVVLWPMEQWSSRSLPMRKNPSSWGYRFLFFFLVGAYPLFLWIAMVLGWCGPKPIVEWLFPLQKPMYDLWIQLKYKRLSNVCYKLYKIRPYQRWMQMEKDDHISSKVGKRDEGLWSLDDDKVGEY